MKIRTLAPWLTHLLFASLLALAVAKSAREPEPSGGTLAQHEPVRTAQARMPGKPRSKVDAARGGKAAAPERDPLQTARNTPAAINAPIVYADAPAPETQTREQAKPEPRPLTRNERLMRRLVAAYPDVLAGYDDNAIIWRDGTRMSFDDGREKTFKERLGDPDIEDQFYAAYPRGLRGVPPLENVDPGRVRNEPFFTKMYGNCKRDPRSVSAKLEKVVWLPENYGKTLRVTSVNGVADALRKVSSALDKLPGRFMKYLKPSAGAYHCRTIAGTERFSVHAFGAAVDINAKYGDYWRWSGAEPGEPLNHRNRIPWEIVEIFEQHGFIWGGKWYHYDTLHFEYRPELLNAPPVPAPAPAPVPAKRPAPGQRAGR